MGSTVGFVGSFYVQKGAWMLEVGCRAVEHFRLPASTVNTLGIGSQLSKYWNIYWRLVSSLSIGKIDGIFSPALSDDSFDSLIAQQLGFKGPVVYV